MKFYKSIFVIACAIFFLIGCGAHPKLSLDKDTYSKDDTTVTVKLSKPVKNKKDAKYWVCVAPAKSAPSEWGSWAMVPDNVTSVDIAIKIPFTEGKYEVRLHSDYSKKPFNLVAKLPITVK
ncbi:MAG: hypothetical protein GY754_05940 [bacterium]|nr:hypothetical protein [bacterium]